MTELTNEDIGKCYNFSYECLKTTKAYISKRNKYAATEKMISDHFIGKLAEIHCYNYFSINSECNYPDFEITNNKTHGADLVVESENGKFNLHVKCVRFDSPVKNSWLAQKNEYSVKNPTAKDYYALCVFHNPKNIEIVKITAAKNIHWKPTKANLPSKVACYLEDMI